MEKKDLFSKFKKDKKNNTGQESNLDSSQCEKKSVSKKIKSIFKDLFIKIKNFKLKEFIKNCKNNKIATLSALATIFFVLSIVVLSFGLNSIFGRQQSKIRYIEENGIKFIGIKNGFITEKLIVESGEEMPAISEYFDKDYRLDADASISYFNGDTQLSLDEFTYQKDGITYLRGYQTIDVVINNDGESYSTTLVINDTTSPTITLQELTIYQGQTLDSNSFVAVFIDNSQLNEFTSTLIGSVDYSSIGSYDINISVCDIANNCTDGATKLTVQKNKTNSSNNSGVSNNEGSEVTIDKNDNKNDNKNNDKNDKNDNKEENNDKPSEPTTPAKRVYVGTKTEKNYPIKYIDHYGAKEIIYDKEVTYDYYSDGYKIITKTSGDTYIDWDYTGYKADVDKMKIEAKADLEDLSTFLDKFLGLINTKRSKVEVSNLNLDYNLSVLAQVRALEILYGDKISHTRPNGSDWSSLLEDFGYSDNLSATYAETLSFGHSSDELAFNALVQSEEHYDIMVSSKYKKVGLGRFTIEGYTVWVQIFSS